MNKLEAYRMVFEDLIKKSPIYLGVYDAYNGDEHFMNGFMIGIYSVMEEIMKGAVLSEDTLNMYEDAFFSNMERSQEYADRRRATDEIIGSFKKD